MILYIIGLVLAFLYLLLGFDDFLWDIYVLFKTVFKRKPQKYNLKEVFEEPPKLMAVMIAAWQEDAVIEDVLKHFLKTTIYPKSQYHVFVGVYPNDVATIEAVKRVQAQFPNVHPIINELEGPTTKAQNLNYVMRQIINFEKEMGWTFQSFTVHDSEDVIHPYELRMTNYLLKEHGGLQFPVFPLIEYPTLSNFFKNITTNTYADEFAEHHYLSMVFRSEMKAFVPSAGTGFALRRDVMEKFPNYAFLPTDSLTEDYKLAYELYKKGEYFHFVLNKVPYIDRNMKVKQQFVATRSMFPKTFETAVRQKKRWITGITMQSIKFRRAIKEDNISFVAKYSLYRDQKAKVGNLLSFVGYPVFIYFLFSLFLDIPPIYPKGSLGYFLSILVSIMMLERLIFRSIAIYNVYGLKSVFYSTFFPPLIPIRYVWGSIINFTATFQALMDKFKVERKEKRKKLKWDKTEHHFLEQEVLTSFYKRLGDLLLKQGAITPKRLRRALKQSRTESLGMYLVRNQEISEKDLLRSLAYLHNTNTLEFGDLSQFISEETFKKLPISYLKAMEVFPVYLYDSSLVLASSYKLSFEKRKLIEVKLSAYKITWVYASIDSIKSSYANPSFFVKNNYFLFMLKRDGKIDIFQFLLVANLVEAYDISVSTALEYLGLNKIQNFFK